MAEAKKLAAEGSWAKARDLASEALKAAPDEEVRRWDELWIAEIDWRSEDRPRDWQLSQRWNKRHLAVFDHLLEPYGQGKSRDDFWAAATEARGKFLELTVRFWALEDWLKVAEYLGTQKSSPAAMDHLMSFLQRTVGDREAENWERGWMRPFLPFLIAGRDGGTDAGQRAWCAFMLAEYQNGEMAERAAAWKKAVELASNTRWEALARAEEFLWRVNTGWNRDGTGSATDIPAMLNETRAFHRDIEKTDGAWAARTTRTLHELEKCLLSGALDLEMPARFGSRETASFAYGAAGYDHLEVEIYAHTPESWGRWELNPKENPLSKVARLVLQWRIPLPSVAELRWEAEVVPLPESLPPGLYTLSVKAHGLVETSRENDFVVSDLGGLLSADAAGNRDLFVFRQDSLAPIAHKEMTGTVVGAKTVEEWSGTTDEGGRIALPRGTKPEQAGAALRMVAVVDGHPVAIACGDRRATRGGELVADFFLDRALYKPGETVKWKAIIRERRAGHWVVPDKKMKMSVALNNEPLLKETELNLNERGTAHGEILIPATARPGHGSIELKAKGEEDRYGHGYASFQVDNYVPPALTAKIELASGADSLRPGREVVVRVASAYLSGGPATGGRVMLKTNVAWKGGPIQTQVAGMEHVQRWISETKAEKREAITDANGAAEFHLQIPAPLPGSLRLSLAATVVPEGGQAVRAEADWWITPTGLRLEMDRGSEPTPRWVRPKSEVSFECHLCDGSGAPSAFTGVAQLVEKRWVGLYLDPKGQVVDRLPPEAGVGRFLPGNPGMRLPDGWTVIHADYVETMVAKMPVKAGVDGLLAARFAAPRAGVYRLKVVDARNNEVTDVMSQGSREEQLLTVVVADETTHSLSMEPSEGGVFFTGHVRSNEPLTALVVLPETCRSAVVTVAGEDETVGKRVDLEGRVGLVVFDRWPRCAGSGRIKVAAINAWPSFGWGSAGFVVDPEDDRPSIEITPDRGESRPGAEARLTLQVRRGGRVEPNDEIALAITDEAVNNLAGPSPALQKPPFERWHHAVINWIERTPAFPTRKLRLLRDPRLPGPDRSSVERGGNDDEVVTLSPFEVSTEGLSIRGYYAAKASLSGTRLGSPPTGVSDSVPTVTFSLYESPITVRTHFASTAFWAPEIMTDEKGRATVEFKYPDDLTQWRISAYAVGADGESFARATAFTRTSLLFQARLQAPRFLVAGDTASPSALLVNRTGSDVLANAKLKVNGAVTMEPGAAPAAAVPVPKQGEARTAWAVKAGQPGTAMLTLTARTDGEGDAMETPLPVIEDGIQQQTVGMACLAGADKARSLGLVLPEPLDRARTTATIQLSSGHASAVLDALPYLIDYPYGCVEQTMNRFLPAIVAGKTLADAGLDRAAVERRILSRESKADEEQRKKTAGLGRLDEVVKRSLARLVEAQKGDGGFGWWPGAATTDLWMTAYVLWGCNLARSAGVDVPEHLVKKTAEALKGVVIAADRADDRFAWALAALEPPESEGRETKDALALAYLRAYAAKDRLSSAGRACLALATVKFGTAEQRAVLLRNLQNGAVHATADGLGETVHWGSTGGYWRAMDGAVEATALNLLALMELDPKHPLIEPAATWLLLNRRSAHWASTRDTAFAVLALNRYMAQRGDFNPDGAVKVFLNGKPAGQLRFDRESLLGGTTAIPLDPAQLTPGENRIELQRVSGSSPIYAAAVASSWAAGSSVKPAGSLVAVARGFDREKTQAAVLGTLQVEREPIANGGAAAEGEQVVAKVTLKVPNQLEYVMVEVPKPAGCEPLNPLSGWDARLLAADDGEGKSSSKDQSAAKAVNRSSRYERMRAGLEDEDNSTTDLGQPIYREEHDEKSVFFLDHIDAGTWEIHFAMRATTPGDFRVLPVEASTMYVPEVRANTDSMRMQVKSR